MILAKILFPIAFICFAFFLLIISAIKLAQPNIINSENSYSFSSSLPRKIYESSFSSLPKEEIPLYPGILPNHPLYFVKMLRDKIILTANRNPQKKLFLLLEYSDKRLTSGQILLEQKEFDLAISTITKAEKYLQKAGIFAIENLDQNQDQKIFSTIAQKYLTHRNIIEQILISDIPEGEKQILHTLQNSSNCFFEDRYLSYINIIKTNIASPSALPLN